MDTQKLTAAKLWIISASADASGADAARDQPYLATALFASRAFSSTHVPRIAVDTRWRLYVNPTWLGAADVREVGKELAHLTWHLLEGHADRAHACRVDVVTAPRWRKAADASLTDTLVRSGLKPEHLASPFSIRQDYGGCAEEYYAKLTDADDNSADTDAEDCGSGADGVSRGYELPPGLDSSGISRQRAAAIRYQVAIECREHAMARGNQYGRMGRWATGILEPTVRWEQLLAAAIRRAVSKATGRGDYTYQRPSRRSAAVPRVVLPGQHRPVPRIAMVIDTSSSVDDVLLARALGEVDQLLLTLNIADAGAMIYSVDAAVHSAQRVRRARDVVLVGAGGTDMRIGMTAAAEARPTPDVIIVFTDGYTPWPEQPPQHTSVVVALLAHANAGDLPATPDWVTRIECRSGQTQS